MAVPYLGRQPSDLSRVCGDDNITRLASISLDPIIKRLGAHAEPPGHRRTLHALLTPTRRLPGFSGDWECHDLGKVASLKARIGWQGLTTNEYQQEGPYGLITGTDFKNGKIDWSGIVFVEEERYIQDVYRVPRAKFAVFAIRQKLQKI